ncbi:MAG: hypothetical protein ABSE15_05005 [Candidatus Bathyarchaeia archaeon]|jgi:hypothetical protein
MPEENVPVTKAEEEKGSYSLASSKKGLGELDAVKVDKFGNVIDGFHRLGENVNWRREVLDWIDTPEKLEAARLAVNFARRSMAPQEVTERITNLLKAGIKAAEIAELTGISERTIAKYTPQEFKNPQKVEAGKASKLQNSAEALQQTVNTSDTKTDRDRLVEAVDTATYTTCPVCHSEPVQISSLGLPYVVCINGHEWHLQKGPITLQQPKKAALKNVCEGCIKDRTCDHSYKYQNKDGTEEVCHCKRVDVATGSYLDRMKECGDCGLMFFDTSLENGLCDKCSARCRTKTTEPEKAITQPELVPVDEEPAKVVILSPITFLVKFPKEIKVDAQKLAALLTECDYDDTLPNRIIKDVDQGVTVSFDLNDWHRANMEDGAPDHTSAEIFKEELISTLESEQLATWTEANGIVVLQLWPKAEKPKPVKEIDFEHVGRSCPCCLRPLTEEGYQRCEKRLGEKYPDLFGIAPKQKAIKCECGQEILVLPDIAEMSKAIEEHAKNACIYGKEGSVVSKQTVILHLTQDLLRAVAGPAEAAE